MSRTVQNQSPLVWEKEPPHAIEAEEFVLGACLIDAEAMDTAAEVMQGEEFFLEKHRLIFKRMLELLDDEEPVELVSVVGRLQDNGELDDVGGLDYLSRLSSVVISAQNTAYYAQQVKDKHLHRRAIDELRGALESAYAVDGPAELISRMQAGAEMLSEQAATKTDFKLAKDVAVNCYENLEKATYAKEHGEVTGIPSGFNDLDKMTAGFQRSDLIILAARPSMGKTALALNIAQTVALDTKETVAVFSLEMGATQLVNRMICTDGHIDAGRMRTGSLQSEEWDKVSMAIGRISDAPIYIDDSAALTVNDIRAKCRRLKKEKGLGLILIDYLQLISGGRGKHENRQQEVSDISRSLKQLARELDVPVIALSQLSRGVEQRQDKRPMMSDLRDSGAIEQDADIVAFLYRDDYYDKETDRKNVIEIIIAKQRNGPVGTVELAFMKQYGKFVSLDRGHHEQKPTPPPTDLNKRRWAK